MGKITWSRRIISDIYAASEYHRPFAPEFADRLIDEIFAKGRLLEMQPLMGRIVPEAGRPDIRELLHKKYRIVYQVIGTGQRADAGVASSLATFVGDLSVIEVT